jgi:4-carboxymuconolactone decarboxylase
MHMTAKMVAKLMIAGVIGAAVGAAVVATAAPEFNTHGNRFKPLTYAELTPEQRAFADKEIAGGRKPETGPFNIYLRSPQMAELSRPYADYLRFKAPMPRKLKEISTMLTARYWGGQYVWYSHRQQALDAGLSPAFIAAMAAGERPASMAPDEATVYDFTTQLLTTRQVSDANFNAMKALVGERGIVEMVGTIGHFTGLTMLFVVDRYPVPPGAPDEVNKPM